MRLALDMRRALVQRLPDLEADRLRVWGRKHVCERQHFLARLLGLSYERQRPHSLDRDADSFDRDFLVQGLRISPRGSRYTPLLNPFYLFPEGNRGYSKDKGTTKAYRIRPTALKALHAVYRGDEPVPVILYDDDENEVGIDTLPANGIPQSLTNRFTVPSVLPIKLSEVNHATERVAGWISQFGEAMYLDPGKPQSTTLAEAQRTLHTSRKWAISLGGLPNLYREQSHGRLGPSGFHLITMPARLRRLIFEGSGMVDYDLASSFWSIFQSLSRAFPSPTPNVNEYVNWKADWHSRWARLTGHHSPNDFKAVVASWLTGGTLSASPRTESGQRLGGSVMRALSEDPAARRPYKEVQDGMKRIVREMLKTETDGTEKVYINAVGKRLTLEGTPSDGGRLRSHTLTGYEQFAIREICEHVVGLKAIIYDGFIASAQPVGPLEDRVRRRSQEVLRVTLDVRLKTGNMSEPLPDLERDPSDF
jgi:hypothetical protein